MSFGKNLQFLRKMGNGMKEKFDKNIISCFEREYEVDGVWHMDVYIAVE